jgi:membrane-associated phospholipid phosphatase
LFVVLAFGRAARAEPVAAKPDAGRPGSRELEHTTPVFLATEFGAALALSASLVLLPRSPGVACRWCASDGLDETVRDALRASNPRSAAALSHAFSTGAAPSLALAALLVPPLARGHSSHALENVVIALDSVMLTFGVTQGAKRSFGRARPAVHHGVVGATEYADKISEWNQSFFSSDTSLAFALGSSAATISYLRGYPSAPWIVFATGVVGTGTALLRVAADVHWATDVLAGAAVGTAIGIAVPCALHGRVEGASAPIILWPIVAPGRFGLVLSLS